MIFQNYSLIIIIKHMNQFALRLFQHNRYLMEKQIRKKRCYFQYVHVLFLHNSFTRNIVFMNKMLINK